MGAAGRAGVGSACPTPISSGPESRREPGWIRRRERAAPAWAPGGARSTVGTERHRAPLSPRGLPRRRDAVRPPGRPGPDRSMAPVSGQGPAGFRPPVRPAVRAAGVSGCPTGKPAAQGTWDRPDRRWGSGARGEAGQPAQPAAPVRPARGQEGAPLASPRCPAHRQTGRGPGARRRCARREQEPPRGPAWSAGVRPRWCQPNPAEPPAPSQPNQAEPPAPSQPNQAEPPAPSQPNQAEPPAPSQPNQAEPRRSRSVPTERRAPATDAEHPLRPNRTGRSHRRRAAPDGCPRRRRGGGSDRRRRGRGSGLGGRLRARLDFDGPAQSLLIGPTTDAVGLLLLDARGVALDADPELEAQVQRFFVGEAELTS